MTKQQQQQVEILDVYMSLTISARVDHSGGGSWRSEGRASGERGQSGGRGAAYRKSPGQPRAQRLTASRCRLRGLAKTHRFTVALRV